RFIFTHAGGTIPMLAQRITRQAESVPEVAARLPHGAMYELKRLHFDTATSTSTPTLAALRAFLPPDNILLGTDYPYLPPAATLAGLDASGFDPALLQRIYHDNARQLLG
ncbi:MAG: amidohydrolase family protein, partial [Vulcanimicrobiaceae bacterium]